MTDDVKKREWIARCEATALFHKIRLRANPDWKLIDTAKELGRSKGRISEDLMINEWLKTHRKQIERFKYMIDALDYIRNKKKELRLI